MWPVEGALTENTALRWYGEGGGRWRGVCDGSGQSVMRAALHRVL